MPIYFISKKNGNRYSKDSNGVRRLKLIYNTEDFEYIYNNEFPEDCGECVICGKHTKFISFTKGYEQYCSKCKASHRHCFIEGYAEFVKENYISLYKDIWSSTDCIDPYDKVQYHSNKVPFSSYALKYKSKYDVKSEFWLIDKQCSYCGKSYKVSIFDADNSHTCIEHHGINNSCIHKFLIDGQYKEISLYNLRNFCESLSYKEFLSFLEDNKVYICNFSITKEYTLLSIIKHLFSDIEILRNIVMDFFFFEKYSNKENQYLYYKDIPIRVYRGTTMWMPAKERWNNILTENTPKYCFWCGNKISDTTKYEVVELENKTLVFLEEYNLCNLQCRNEYYKLHNNYKSKLDSEITKLKKKQSDTIKRKIEDGSFTPNIVNSLTRKSFYCDEYPEYKFRSSWELIFWYMNKNILSYTDYERVRIPYIDENGERHTYIVDFIDETNNILYEIKPKSKENDTRNILKREEAKKWCLTYGYEFVIINEDYFLELINNNTDFSFLGSNTDKVIKSFMR